MTRFARAKGSKSSNSRSAEDATDWRYFKSQPVKSNEFDAVVKKSNEFDAVVKKTIKQIKESGPPKASGWADFGVSAPQTTPKSKAESSKNESIDKPQRKRKQKKSEGDNGTLKKAKPNEPEKSEKSSQSQENFTSNGVNPNKSGKFQKRNQSKEKPKKGNQSKKKSKAILLPDGTYKRRKPFVESHTLQINGKSVQITKFDGYDVRHEDAVRLKEIRQKMQEKGIPKDEIDAAMKKERRNAEKALLRVKKKVCFNCRKFGHPLSECPELDSGDFKNVEKTGTSNICYKCGSTEHTHYQCQVKKNKDYSFATCFICKEQGHISSQCPDNPKGLYPKGGSCKVCGEVTHLKKDCPQLAKDRSENVLTLDTFSSTSNVESLEEKAISAKSFNKTPRQKKIIKF